MESLTKAFSDAYFFQQCVLFLMWLGLLKIALGELKAFWEETVQDEPLTANASDREPLKIFGENMGGGWRGAASNAWRITESDTPQRLRRYYGKKWGGVGPHEKRAKPPLKSSDFLRHSSAVKTFFSL